MKLRLAMVSCLVASAMTVCAQDVPAISKTEQSADAERVLVDQWMTQYDKINSSLQVVTDLEGEKHKVDQHQALLTFLNPEFSGRHGRFYVWTDEGRPVITSSIFSQIQGSPKQYRTVIFEFHSLVQQTVSVAREDKVLWQCQLPGMQWMEGPPGIVPAANPVRRLSQMRAIAQSFTAESSRREFRLLTQPIYRYPPNTPEVIDGAIFSYGITTDPCVLLLIEARDQAWKIAFVRSNNNSMRVLEGSKEIWSQETVSDPRLNPTQPFFLYWGAEHRALDEPSELLKSSWKE